MIIKIESMEEEVKELFNKRRREIELLEIKKINRSRFIFYIIELMIAVVGYGLICKSVSIWLALGIWLVIFSNNMFVVRTTGIKKTNILQKIWKDE